MVEPKHMNTRQEE